MKRPLLIIGIILLMIAIILGAYANMSTYQPQAEKTDSINDTTEETKNQTFIKQKKLSCIGSGGTVANQSCCKAVEDFSNNCIIGGCGCSPDNSHEVEVCNCPEEQCFDGNVCVQRNSMITIYCVSNGCSPQQIFAGAGTLAHNCYRNLNDCTSAI